jgi:uncharacterized repeat protein (TIGR03847 family)
MMPRRFFVFEDPDRFVTGTVGRPGQRTFFLQAVQRGRIASVALEKVQVAVLADRVAAILAELQRRGVEGATDVAAVGDDDRELDEPLREEFRVGTLTISWDNDEAELLVEARSAPETDDEEGDEDPDAEEALEVSAEAAEDDDDDVPDDSPIGPDVLRVRLTPGMAMGFARRAQRVVSAGRPPCPFCGQPLNPEGHLCARRNGYLN